MPSYSGNAFSLEEAHAAATTAGFKPSRLNNRNRFSFNSRACHVGGDSSQGCWATERDGRLYFHCHKHGNSKTDWLEAQRRITGNLGLPEYRAPAVSNSDGRPYQVREWTYHNPATGESAVQVVERYDGACHRADCGDRFAHKHPWLRRQKGFSGKPTDGFLLLEHAAPGLKTPENRGALKISDGNPCTSCIFCTRTPVPNGVDGASGVPNWAVIAEGETTAEAAAACGWRAFSYQGGSNGAGKADYSHIAGMSILIAPDNDRPGTKATLTAAIRCLEAGATEVRIMSTDAFQRRGEDLADLDESDRARVIENCCYEDPGQLGPLTLQLAVHNLRDRCLASTVPPLIEASDREHLDQHVEQVWKGILDREERESPPTLFVKDGRLVYLTKGAEGERVITEHTRDSIAIVAAESAFWHQDFHQETIVAEPVDGDDLPVWQAAAAALDGVAGQEHGWVLRLPATRREQPATFRYVLQTPKPRHPQRSVTNALLINPPEDLPELDAVISHPFLSATGDRLITEEGYHPTEQMYLQNPYPFVPVPLQSAIEELEDLFVDFPTPTQADRTNLYAAIVTKICRRSYSIAPLVMIDKPKSGTGATLLAELVALLTTGCMPMRATYCNGEMLEFEKRVAATCRNANGIVLMDNLAGTIVSNTLAELLTAEDKFLARELGASRNVSIDPRNYVMLATANNVSMAAELVNRTLHVRLDAGMERPDHRNGFRHPAITEYLIANLPRLRNAALSLVHHWLELGRPVATELPWALRRFPAWERQTAAILQTAGLDDFAANAVEFEERVIAQVEASVHPFIQWWWDTHQGNPVGVKELAHTALGDPEDEDAEGMLQVNGSNDKARRINLAKMVKGWLHQTFELSDSTVRLMAGPMVKKRYATWMLQEPDSGVGAFPLIDIETSVLVQEMQEVQGFQSEIFRAPLNSGVEGACSACGRPLLPDEPGPDCQDCNPQKD